MCSGEKDGKDTILSVHRPSDVSQEALHFGGSLLTFLVPQQNPPFNVLPWTCRPVRGKQQQLYQPHNNTHTHTP
jgi:hypothetical protein